MSGFILVCLSVEEKLGILARRFTSWAVLLVSSFVLEKCLI